MGNGEEALASSIHVVYNDDGCSSEEARVDDSGTLEEIAAEVGRSRRMQLRGTAFQQRFLAKY